VRPALILKNGYFAWGALGEGNASVEDVEPVRYGGHWGAYGKAAAALSTTFVSKAALDARIGERLSTGRRVVAVRGTREIRRDDLVANREVVPIDVDPRDGTVSLDGRVLACEPSAEVPLSRRFLLG